MNKNSTFESILGNISSSLINPPLESIDVAIESSIKRLVEFFEVDRCHLGEFSYDHTKIEVSYFYSRPGIDIPQISDVGEHYLSFVYESIKKDKLIAISNTRELPDQAKQDRAVLDKMGIKSLLILPIKIDDVVQFGFSLSTITKHINWEKKTINRIMIAANILGNAMQRRLFLEKINREKEWSEAVMEGMPQITYVFDLEGKLKRWNKDAEAVLGYSTKVDPISCLIYNDLNGKQVELDGIIVQKLIATGNYVFQHPHDL